MRPLPEEFVEGLTPLKRREKARSVGSFPGLAEEEEAVFERGRGESQCSNSPNLGIISASKRRVYICVHRRSAMKKREGQTNRFDSRKIGFDRVLGAETSLSKCVTVEDGGGASCVVLVTHSHSASNFVEILRLSCPDCRNK